uniref:Uncharacterized protein n=1 Tax=Siphoviridae sp. ctWWc42 TaxID=2826361 RepID=A0A8S5R2B4_9CAUD|nr:MAG TPA: hypothetical protein [Siphoviridae sp. ctWWc42]
MELKQYSTSIEFNYDGYITCYMVRQLKLYILDNPYIDDVVSIKIIHADDAFEKHLLEITVLHHAGSDLTVNTMINKLFMDFLNYDYLFMKSKRIM